MLSRGPCTFYVKAPIAVVALMTSAFGFTTVAVPVPDEAILYGAEITAQAFVVDPTGPFAGSPSVER